jgi:uncharacterized damage-inducible protein DinB
MPVPGVIQGAAQSYRYNDKFLADCVNGLSAEEWHRRPSDCSNPMAWIVGHLLWARKSLLGRLGAEWSAPWLGLYGRCAKAGDGVQPPSTDDLMAAWTEVSGILKTALENVPEEALSEPASQGPPSADGKVSGIVNFLAYHETYHVGQAAYLRCWLGHKGVMG